MWMIVRDHLWRNRRGIAFSFLFMSFILVLASKIRSQRHDVSFVHTQIYLYFWIMSLRIRQTDANVIQVWRMLPLRRATLAKLVWSVTTTIPVALAFLIVVVVEVGLFCFGKTQPEPPTWPLLFLLLVTLCSGVFTFGEASMLRGSALAAAARHAGRKRSFSSSYAGGLVLMFATLIGVAYLLFIPTPTEWSTLTPKQYAGIALAAWLTWESYRMRHWLLRTASVHKGLVLAAQNQETTPLVHVSERSGLIHEMKITIQGALRVQGGASVLGGLALFGLAKSGFAPPDSDLYRLLAVGLTFFLLVIAALIIFGQVIRLAELRALRALPLTGNQCALLVIGFPYTASVVVMPFAAVALWFAGYGSLPTLLIAGTLFCVGLCPFAQFLLALFGQNALMGITVIAAVGMGMGAVSSMKMVSDQTTGLPSMPTLCAFSLLSAVLCLTGYLGLRHLIQNSSAVYKRKLFPLPFGQGLGR